MLHVDAHSHVGTCRVFDADQSPAALEASMERHGIDVSIVQPFPGAPDAAAVHDLIAQLALRHPGRIFGTASLTPHQDADSYRAELERCVRKLGFVAVKAHTIGHAVNPRAAAARLIFQTATDLGIPVMVHTGHGVPFADPAAWIPLSLEFSETTVILAHAGAPGYTSTAIVAAEVCPNIVLETSWCSPHDIGRAIRTLGAQRVMYGSDLHFNPGVEMAKYQSLGLSQDELELCLGGNAIRVYQLNVPSPIAT